MFQVLFQKITRVWRDFNWSRPQHECMRPARLHMAIMGFGYEKPERIDGGGRKGKIDARYFPGKTLALRRETYICSALSDPQACHTIWVSCLEEAMLSQGCAGDRQEREDKQERQREKRGVSVIGMKGRRGVSVTDLRGKIDRRDKKGRQGREDRRERQ